MPESDPHAQAAGNTAHVGRSYRLGLGLLAVITLGTTALIVAEANRAAPKTLRAALLASQRAEARSIVAFGGAITDRARETASAADAEALRITADSLGARGRSLLATVVAADAALGDEHARSVVRIQRIAIGFCLTLFAVLTFEWLVVFRPATRRIGELLQAQEVVKNELYAKAEEMYQNSVQQEMQNDTLQQQQQTLLEQQEQLVAQQSTLIEQRDRLEERATELSRLTAILDATPDAVAVFALTGDVLYANASAEQHLQHVRKRDWTHASHLLAPDSVRQLRDVAFPRAIHRGLWQGEATLRTREGVARTVVQTLIAHRAPDGRVATVSVLLQDITEQKALQRKLAEDEARNRSIVEALAEGVVVQDASGTIVQWNAAAERILCVSGDELTGRTSVDGAWQAIDASGVALPADRLPIARARVGGVSIDGEVLRVKRGDGSVAWLSVNARPMPDRGAASRAAAVATFTDITASLAAARELETLSVVARQTDHGIVIIDRAGRITWVNTAWEVLSGYTRAEVEGRNPADILHGPHTRPETIAGIEAAHAAGRRWSGEILHYRRDGTPYWVELNATPTSDASGKVTGFIGLIRDITTRRHADRERQQLAAAVAVTADGIAITGVSGALEFVNHAFARMHGDSVAALLQTPWAALYEPEESRRLVRDAIPEVTQVGFWHGEATGRHRDGSAYPQELSLTLLPHGGLVAVARDISERKASEEQLRRISVRDELTSLYNRRGFLEQSASTLRLAARQGIRCALFYGDLDSFKSVNDGFGHNAGDAALQTMAGILTDTFRETDLVARIGGDEFTILAIDVQPADVALISQRIEAAVQRSNTERSADDAQAWHLGISLGVAYFDPDAPEDVEALLKSADALQYEEKRHRKAQPSQAA
ncbi:MAG: PAS domain S-box protein [Gemmatimonadota bacterium]